MKTKAWLILFWIPVILFVSNPSAYSCDDWVLWRLDGSNNHKFRKDAFATKKECSVAKEMQKVSDSQENPSGQYSYVCLPSSMKP